LNSLGPLDAKLHPELVVPIHIGHSKALSKCDFEVSDGTVSLVVEIGDVSQEVTHTTTPTNWEIKGASHFPVFVSLT
jgi:hypothetical protein